MERRKGTGPGAVSGSSGGDLAFAGTYPLLWEHLSATKFADGSPRETSTLLVFFDGQGWKVALKDRAEGEVAFITTQELSLAWDVLERGLGAGTLDWKPDQFARGKGRRK